MLNYHEKNKRFEGWEIVVRDMRICISLIDIFTERRNLFHYDYDGDIVFKPIGDDDYELTNTPDFEYHCDVKVNLKNLSRFVDNKNMFKFYEKSPHEFYILKAKTLYHKIRLEHDGEWWD